MYLFYSVFSTQRNDNINQQKDTQELYLRRIREYNATSKIDLKFKKFIKILFYVHIFYKRLQETQVFTFFK